MKSLFRKNRMAKQSNDSALDLGVNTRRTTRSGLTSADIIALGLSLVWLLGVGGFFVFSPRATPAPGEQGLNFVMTLLAVFLPVAVIWLGAMSVRSARVMREEAARLQATIDGMRHTYLTQVQNAGLGNDNTVAQKLDEIVASQKQTEQAIFSTKREDDQPRPALTHTKQPILPTSTPAPSESQPTLELGTTAEDFAPPLTSEDFIRAMNFPETADDAEGFAALRRALKDRDAARVIQSAQDVLTLLSQDGIYMDDLRPDRARPEVWRLFASGARGRAVASLGGVRDRSCLALTSGRMRQDPIFRDAAHHFLRQFDQVFSKFENEASDQNIAEFSDTRTARAFMLLGRVSGTFD